MPPLPAPRLLHGAFAFAVLAARRPNTLVAAAWVGGARRLVSGAPKGPNESSSAASSSSAERDAAADEADRQSRLAALRDRLRTEWTVWDPLHLRWVLTKTVGRGIRDPDLLALASGTLAAAAYVAGGLTLAGTLGIDTKPVLALGSVTGVTVGLALKDITANWLSGVLLVATRPFRRGDYIVCSVPSVGRVEGRVEGIDTRLVYLRLEDGKKVLVPTSLIFNNPITVTPAGK